MHQSINTLISLQEVLLELDQVRLELNKVPNQLQEINDKQDLASGERDELQNEIEELDAELVRLQTENKEESDRVTNYDKRLKSLKTNREYQALLREIGFSRKLVAETEMEMKEKNEIRREKLEKIEELEALIAELEESKGSMSDEWNQSQAELGAREKVLIGDQEKVQKDIPRDLMSKYTMIRRRHANAIVDVHNSRCTGCNMAVPPQQFNRILRGSDVINCNSCSRILYVKPPEEEPSEEAAATE